MHSEATSSKTAEVVVREPSPDETPRALYLFKQLLPPGEAQLFVAVRTQPISRLAGAGAVWLQGKMAFFRIVCQPGVSRSLIASLLIGQLERWGVNHGAELIRCADLLPDENEWRQFFQERGFQTLRSERFFQVSYNSAHDRAMALAHKCQNHIPKTWRTEAIRRHVPETVAHLITQHRLLPVSELRQYWRADVPFGFDMDASCVLFDNDEVIGTLLIRRGFNAFALDVRVVACQNAYLRALGNIGLFHHVAKLVNRGGPIQWLEFRGGEIEHVETANLAIRMGGREMPERKVWGKKL
jgi:hypothetical protein